MYGKGNLFCSCLATCVIPAKAGIFESIDKDSRLRGNDNKNYQKIVALVLVIS